MKRIFVKICGMTEIDQALTAAEAGADALGFVFWGKSPRVVTPGRAREISRGIPPFVTRVGVFVDPTPDELARACDEAALDIVQLHGSESAEAVACAPRRAIKALRVGPGFDAEEAMRYVQVGAGVLLDTQSPGAPGGTGKSFDWSLARGLAERVPFLVLAGGLNATNVGAALRRSGACGVDVSSGVELEAGQKNTDKVRHFIAAAREAGRFL